MGLLKYIKEQRETRLRLEVLKLVAPHCGALYGIYMRFLKGDDNALSELPDYQEFRLWKEFEKDRKPAKPASSEGQ